MDTALAGAVIKQVLSALDAWARLTGGFQLNFSGDTQREASACDGAALAGLEGIWRSGAELHRLASHGGMTRASTLVNLAGVLPLEPLHPKPLPDPASALVPGRACRSTAARPGFAAPPSTPTRHPPQTLLPPPSGATGPG